MDLAILETVPIMNRVLIVMVMVERLETLAMMLVSPLEDRATLETIAMMNPATIIFRLQLHVYWGGDVILVVKLSLVRLVRIILLVRTAEACQYLTADPSLVGQVVYETFAAMNSVLALSKMLVALVVFGHVGVSCDDRNLEGPVQDDDE